MKEMYCICLTDTRQSNLSPQIALVMISAEDMYTNASSLFTAKRAKSYTSLMNIQDKQSWRGER